MKKQWWIGLTISFVSAVILIYVLNENEAEKMYQNPVYEPVLADPSIIAADDGYYYAYGTEDAWGDLARTVPIPIVKSSDLIHWEYVGPAFEEKPSWKVSGDLWAPHIAYYNNQYVLFYSYSRWGDDNPAIGLAVSEIPTGPFLDLGKLFSSDEIGVANSIDPFLFVENETPYLFWGSFYGTYAVELTDDLKQVVGTPVEIADEQYEAVYIKEKAGEYYFFGSRGSCCDGPNSTYNVGVGKATDLLGPYRDQSDIALTEGGGTLLLTGNDIIAGPGHNALITDKNGEDWLVYHGIVKDEPHLWTGASRRPLFIDRIRWEEGWPTIENNTPSVEQKEGPAT